MLCSWENVSLHVSKKFIFPPVGWNAFFVFFFLNNIFLKPWLKRGKVCVLYLHFWKPIKLIPSYFGLTKMCDYPNERKSITDVHQMLLLASGTERRRTPEKRAKTPAEEPPPKAVSCKRKCSKRKRQKDKLLPYQVGKRLCPREDEEVGKAPVKKKKTW